MTGRSMPETVRTAAHAKANLFLRVLSRDASGYHGLETLFTLLELADEITVARTGAGVDLAVEGAGTGPTAENLAYRAAETVLAATGNRFGVRIQLRKHIPVGAGLGGGSSDAAATLHAVNRLAGDAVPRHELLQCAAKLGADVPFFASGAPMALAWHRGDRLFSLPPPPSAAALVAVPPFGISSAEAYRLMDDSRRDWRPRGSVLLDRDAFGTWGGIGRLGGNDFETVVFGKEPKLKALFERLAETRPLLVRLTGSGSAVVAIYKSQRELEDAAMTVGEREQRLFKTATRPHPVPGPTAA